MFTRLASKARWGHCLILLGTSVVTGCMGSVSTDGSSSGTDVEVPSSSPTGSPAGVDPKGPLAVVGTELACGTKGFALHRLNQREFDNTVRDLLGDDSRPASAFPADGQTEGFDNDQELLVVSPLLVERYEQVATVLADAAWNRELSGGGGSQPTSPPPAQTGAEVKVEAESAPALATVGAAENGFWKLWSVGELAVPFQLGAGTYRVFVRAYGTQVPPDPARFELKLDGAVVATVDVPAVASAPAVYERTIVVSSAGQHTVAVRFINDVFNPANPAEDRNLLVDWVSVAPVTAGGDVLSGPTGSGSVGTGAGAPPLKSCDPASGEAACFRQILERFIRRAWRRPARAEELDGLAGLLPLAKSNGDGFDVAMKLALRAVLLSPNFTFRIDLSADPAAPANAPLDDHALAARLSYFLWSSTPDAALNALADAGTLRPQLASQVQRMLADPKAESLVDAFGGQWLRFSRADGISPDPTLFPNVDTALKTGFKQEAQAYFRHFLTEDESALDMLDAPFSFVNDRLAEHYGLPRPGSSQVMKVPLQGSNRAGLLTQGSFLASASLPTRTSPVMRGKWVLGRLLCKEPPPPPPNVEALPEILKPNATLRERMEAHRASPACNSCHMVMDPIGFGLENFDASGAWRQLDNGSPIDATGSLPGGKSFNGAVELAAQLKTEPDLPHCISEKAFTFAVGRTLRPEDREAVNQLANAFAASNHRLSQLIVRTALSPAFTLSCGGNGVTP